MDKIPISSRNIASVGYDASTLTLEIAFHSGDIYQYNGVHQSEYDSLMKASSHGKYFRKNIKDVYPYTKVD